MKILILGDGGSAHIQKWVLSLAEKGIEIGLFSLHYFPEEIYKNNSGITILNNPPYKDPRSIFSKLNYLGQANSLKRQIDNYKPAILHAHYATSYGMLGGKARFHPYIISVWGSDVYDFPRSTALHKNLLERILSKADMICSTSNCMKEETSKYINTNIQVIPFGVDTNKFSFTEKDLSKNEITIGIIKSLEKKYGIDLLIKAFAEAQKKTDKKLKLLIVGDGSKKLEYKKLCGELGVSDSVEFTGKIAHNEILNFHRRIDVFVSLSTLDSESFGVSLVEAMACGTPVIASDVAGFKEVVGNSENGTLVPKNSYHEAADAILNYIQNPAIATQKAKNARERIVREYDWNKNVGQMISIYHKVLS